ncbi:MAG: class I SAM-dependent methyltransferase [Lachnospiraceae bacterium]|nr:class I SAM-dependent methyltransferase [Lachnospiraceae bacterium]
MNKNIVLSDRLQAIADMVTVGNRVCDVGCDHGFVPIYLIGQGISPKVIAMDVNEGPIKRAIEHIQEYGAGAYIETRLSDGLRSFREGEADSLICAGMGGRLMMRILQEDEAKTASFKEMILQPQSELQQFRCFLRCQGYLIVEENMIEEDGKFYPIMKAVKGEKEDQNELIWWQQMEDRYGAILLQKKSIVLYRYLEKEKRTYEEILKKLNGYVDNDARNNSRYEEVEKKLRDCVRVMETINREGGYGKNQN